MPETISQASPIYHAGVFAGRETNREFVIPIGGDTIFQHVVAISHDCSEWTLKQPSSITNTPGICGGKPCVAATRIPVWGLEKLRQLSLSEREILDRYPSLTSEDLSVAWEYVASHQQDIQQQIREND